MKTAFVLGGGGSRGAYEIGVWKALREMSIDIDIVTGTSIGALNGAFVVQGDFQAALDLYENIKPSDITADNIDMDLSLDNLMSLKNNLPTILKSYTQHKGVDVTPLKQLIDRLLDFEKIKNSPIQYGIVLTQVPSIEKVELTKDGMTKELFDLQVLASASCFPAFPMTQIEDKWYIDGGYCDNCPIDFAIRLGATQLIVVDLSDRAPIHNEYTKFANIKYIHPSRSLGTILNFNKDLLLSNMQLGYYDCLQAFGRLEGFQYVFKKEFNQDLSFMNFLQQAISSLNFFMTFSPNVFYDTLSDDGKISIRTPSDYEYRALELLLELFEMKREEIYSIEQLRNFFLGEYEKVDYDENIFKNYKKIEIATKHAYLSGCIYQRLKQSLNPLEDFSMTLKIFPKESICALYIYMLYSNYHVK